MKIVKLLLINLLCLSLFVPVYAEDNAYQVMDTNSGFSQGFEYYDDAYSFYSDNLDNYDNLLLLDNGKIINMEYGIVEFVGKNNICEYHSILRNEDDYLSGTYGIDGAYLYSDEDSENVYFTLSGDRGYTSIENVVLHPYESIGVSISSYSVNDGYLYHNLKTQLDYEHYSESLCLDYAPSYLTQNNTYYSYDGHYFYEDFYTMINDYRNDTYENAVNDKPYYNYFEYLPYRSLTNYGQSELENYFYNTLGINGRLIHYTDMNNDNAADEVNRSQFYKNINEFFINQNIYGTNAMMLISSGILESSYGKSLNSYIKNNLYLNAAYESDHENENGRYDNIANSIYSQSKYFISRLYSNYQKPSYYGTYFGNKLGGINIEHSLDHYYGEKAAAQYFKLDKALGGKDYKNKALAIVRGKDRLTIYKDSELQNKLFSLDNVTELSFVIIDEQDFSYKINLDYSNTEDYVYDFDDCVGYIAIEDVDILMNDENIREYELNKTNYYFDGGTYRDEEFLSIKSNNPDYSIVPFKAGYEFANYTSEVNQDGNLINIANYRKIVSIDSVGLFEKQGDLLPYPDLTNAKLRVSYDDGTTRYVPVNSDMISVYDASDEDPQYITVTYNGVSLDLEVQIDPYYFDLYNSITEAINNGDYGYVRENMESVNYPLNMSQIRMIDYELKSQNNRNYVINDKTGKFNLSISGLDLSLDDRRNFSLIEDTYYVVVDNANVYNKKKIIDVAQGYGFNTEESINLSFKFNYQTMDLRGPAIVQIDLDNKKNDYIYSVYHLNSNDDIIKCRTTQSANFIQFIIDEPGDYVVFSMPSVNSYEIDDHVEDLSYENMGFDNNRINIEFMFGLSLILVCLAGIIIYYNIEDKKEKHWKDYKKSLLKADTAQEEKQKN